MKRRHFIKTASCLAVGSGIALPAESCSSHQSAKYFKKDAPAVLLKTIENDTLRVILFSDGSMKIYDKPRGFEWEMASVAIQDQGTFDEGYVWARGERTLMEQYPATFYVEPWGNAFRYLVLGHANRIKGSFCCFISLEREWLRFTVTDISEDLPSLVFPPHIESDSVIIPSGIGKIFHKKEADIWTRHFYLYQTSLNMCWFGGLKDENAWLAVLDEHIADGGVLQVNNSLAPGWIKSKNRWKKSYSIKYQFLKGGYVELAKTYRRYLIEKGTFVSLKEKIARNQRLADMIGGRILCYFQAWPPANKKDLKKYLFNTKQLEGRDPEKVTVDFTHKEVLASIHYARKYGFKNGMVMLRGWINKGYDGSHPDIWPPEPALGSIDELKEIMALPSPVIPALHDQYQDMYEGTKDFPRGINVLSNGDLMQGGLWAGGQCFILNSKYSVEYARRNWENTKTLQPVALFLDTLTASKFHESWEKERPLTREEDMRYKLQLLKDHKSYGLLIGSEEGSELGIPVCDWYECRHSRKENENIPLFPLVFHDAVFMARYNSFDPRTPYPGWLEDMLWGYLLQFFMTPEFGNLRNRQGAEKIGFGANEMNEKLFTSTFHVDKWHKEIALSEMISHSILTSDGKVEETTFEPGGTIIVNFSEETRTVKGITLPPHSYKILS